MRLGTVESAFAAVDRITMRPICIPCFGLVEKRCVLVCKAGI